ncbi:tyrosine-type recombinase/integrase [Vibrio rotiferianus]|uniref:tyrosine-type recombinase/integrase n=1 Tax=Vibrio rotiferianus TaxID=190895 RepID=UPI00148D8DA2|nr:tyrosine-type recombinase/integrase [Vibrio rotiferianus]NOH69066.1 tyrosine-type recombinase/integrase [Vibrio rotiferianus]
MKSKCRNNARVIHEYSEYLKEARSLDDSTIDGVLKSINRFEEHTNYLDFSRFKAKYAIAFKKQIQTQKSLVTGEVLSKSTVLTTINHLKAFFQYLATQKGYRAKISYSDIEYFNLSEKYKRAANGKSKKSVATIEQIIKTLEVMPCTTPIELRDRAVVAFILLTGARDRAVTSLKLKHLDLNERGVYQDGRTVLTKFRKTISSYFFPVGELPVTILEEWVDYLTSELGYTENSPLFPATKVILDRKRQFTAGGLEEKHWSTASPIRKIFKQAFALSGMQYYKPHSFRNTLVRLGEKICRTPEEFKAWSQNLGHQSVLTTFYSYGDVPDRKQAELLRKLAEPKPIPNQSDVELLQRMMDLARDQGI